MSFLYLKFLKVSIQTKSPFAKHFDKMDVHIDCLAEFVTPKTEEADVTSSGVEDVQATQEKDNESMRLKQLILKVVLAVLLMPFSII